MVIATVMQLTKFQLLRLNVAVDPDHPDLTPQHQSAEVQIHLDCRSDKTQRRFKVVFGLEFTWSPDKPNRFREIGIEVSGEFAFPEDTPEAQIKEWVPTACLMNLVGTMRGILVQSTGSCPGGPFNLPLINLNEILQNFSEKKKVVDNQSKKQLPQGRSSDRSETGRAVSKASRKPKAKPPTTTRGKAKSE